MWVTLDCHGKKNTFNKVIKKCSSFFLATDRNSNLDLEHAIELTKDFAYVKNI
jgi:hypothetical protein